MELLLSEIDVRVATVTAKFTFQYGATTIKTTPITINVICTFTFQYGATTIPYRLFKKGMLP